MKYFILIIIFGMAAIGSFLGCRVLKLLKKNKQLQEDRNELIKELAKERNKYSDVEIKVALTAHEKQMILNALDVPQYKGKVHDPKTNYFIRETYKDLKKKIKESIKEE